MGFMLRRHHQLTPFAVTVPAPPRQLVQFVHIIFFFLLLFCLLPLPLSPQFVFIRNAFPVVELVAELVQ